MAAYLLYHPSASMTLMPADPFAPPPKTVALSMDTPEEDVLEVTYNPAVNTTQPPPVPEDEDEEGPFEK